MSSLRSYIQITLLFIVVAFTTGGCYTVVSQKAYGTHHARLDENAGYVGDGRNQEFESAQAAEEYEEVYDDSGYIYYDEPFTSVSVYYDSYPYYNPYYSWRWRISALEFYDPYWDTCFWYPSWPPYARYYWYDWYPSYYHYGWHHPYHHYHPGYYHYAYWDGYYDGRYSSHYNHRPQGGKETHYAYRRDGDRLSMHGISTRRAASSIATAGRRSGGSTSTIHPSFENGIATAGTSTGNSKTAVRTSTKTQDRRHAHSVGITRRSLPYGNSSLRRAVSTDAVLNSQTDSMVKSIDRKTNSSRRSSSVRSRQSSRPASSEYGTSKTRRVKTNGSSAVRSRSTTATRSTRSRSSGMLYRGTPSSSSRGSSSTTYRGTPGQSSSKSSGSSASSSRSTGSSSRSSSSSSSSRTSRSRSSSSSKRR